MERTKWIDRKFTFDFPNGWIYNILERLRGTEARMREITTGISDENLQMKKPGKWSIKEHIGHLSDLEVLHTGRIDDFIHREKNLRPADMSNIKTNAADHNNRKVSELIDDFGRQRALLISMIEKLDDETQHFKSMHPRLYIQMRPVDVAYFTAEHDDHHLASIREIINSIR